MSLEGIIIKKRAIVFFSICLLSVLVGCGYSSRSILKQNVHTIYVPIFDNKTFRRGLEYGLAKAIKDEIMFKTQLRIVEKEDAETLLNGVIVNFNETVMVVDSNDNIVESRIFIVVDFTWKDLRTGRTIVKKEGLMAPTEFIVDHGETIETAKNESYVDIAEKIVDLMGENW